MHDARELENKIKELESELRQKSDFISIMVHQLRTPISAMKWTFKMMLDGDLGHFSETQERIIRRGLESSNQMVQLLADVSAANHLADWTMKLNPERFDINACIDGTIQEFAEEARGKNITLQFVHDHELPPVMADRDRTCLVVQNLIENAIKYNRPGGSVTVHAEKSSGKLIVAITDTGIGIPSDQQKNIFTKFFRAQNAKAHEKGTGLGLFVGKSIVEQLGGAMWFESNEGVGTTFFFSLPIAE